MEELIQKYKDGVVIAIDKPYTWTSYNVVGKVKSILRNEVQTGKIKVGHAGTLDPLATGLVLVCVGKFTKRIYEFQDLYKEYVAGFTFGSTTPSFDLETEINESFPFEHITKEYLNAIIQKDFLGEILQRAPIFSAKKVDGKRAYDLARAGKEVVMKQNLVEIHEIEITKFELPIVELRIKCSKGTYIRSLANDIGLAAESGAHLSALRRTRIGEFNVETALKPDDLKKYLTTG